MKKILLLFICLQLFFQSKGQFTFERNDSLEGLGLYCCPTAEYIIQTFDSGYLLGGYIVSGTNANYFWEKLDSTGHTQWWKMFGYGSDAYINSIDQTSDHGFIICGNAGPSYLPIGIIKTDFAGNTIWVKYIGIGNGDLYGNCIRQTLDGNYIIAGSKYFPGNWDAELIKLDSTGTILWSKAYGSLLSKSIFYDLVETVDSGFVAVGSTDPNGVSPQIFVVKTNSVGDTLWTKTFQDGLNFTEGISIIRTVDNGFVISGYAKKSWNPGKGSIVFKLNSQGNLLWEKKLGTLNDSLIINSVKQTSDSGLILSGSFYRIGGSGCLIKTNSLGDTIWTKQLNCAGAYVCAANDNGYAIAGGMLATVVKTDYLGNTECHSIPSGFGNSTSSLSQIYTPIHVITDTLINPAITGGNNGLPLLERMLCNSLHVEDIKMRNQQIEIFPNPSDKILFIKSDSKFSDFEIYDLYGKLIEQNKISNQNTFAIDISDLSPSLYFLKLFSKEGSSTLKFLKNNIKE